LIHEGELLKGKVESDEEFYIKSGLKGRSYHEEIIESGRESTRRALKPWKGRKTFEKDQSMIVMCMSASAERIGWRCLMSLKPKGNHC
jgi:hypothetical protein